MQTGPRTELRVWFLEAAKREIKGKLTIRKQTPVKIRRREKNVEISSCYFLTACFQKSHFLFCAFSYLHSLTEVVCLGFCEIGGIHEALRSESEASPACS